MLRRWRALVVVGVALLPAAGCRTVSDQGGLHPLPPPPPGATDFSDYEPDHPYLPTKQGIAERSVYTTDSGDGYWVEVRDILVSPTQREVLLALSGSAVFEVRQGSGTALAGGREIALSPGTVFTISSKESLLITASGEPLAFRTWIVSAGVKP